MYDFSVFSSHFVILSQLKMLCILKPTVSCLSENLIICVISNASEGTEELAHVEMISAMIYQLTRNLSEEAIKKSGFDTYFIDHTTGVFPQAASGTPFTTAYIGVKGDVLADLHEDLAAEQKARVTYDNLLRLIDDPDVREPLKFLRQREIVHYQRFGDALERAKEKMDEKNVYAFNPAFDKCDSCNNG